LAVCQQADTETVDEAIRSALAAKHKWVTTPLNEKTAIFYRAAWLLQNHYRYDMMAATMLGQGKNPYQADIDCVAEVRISDTMQVCAGYLLTVHVSQLTSSRHFQHLPMDCSKISQISTLRVYGSEFYRCTS